MENWFMKGDAMINLNLLGEFQILFNEKDVTTKLSKKGRGLLSYMACQKKRLFYRDHIASMFWSDYNRDSALNNLRYCLWQIRKMYKQSEGEKDLFINQGKHAIKLNFQVVESDYIRFYQEIEFQNYSYAATYYTGDFMGSFYIENVPEFSEWVFNERERLQRTYFEIQLETAKKHAKSNNLHEAIKTLNELIDIDPLNETVYYYLIFYQSLLGNKVTAINTYRSLKQFLRNELNISPSEEVQNLYDSIVKDMKSSPPSTTSIPLDKSEENKNKSLILYVSNEPEKLKKYTQQLSKFENDSNKLVIDICDSPGIRVNYEGLFEILDDLHIHGKYNLKKYQTEFAPIVFNIRNRQVVEDLYFFNQFEMLLDGELSSHHIFRVWNLHFLDSKTIDFLSYLYRKKTPKRLTIIGVYDSRWNNSRVDDFFAAHKFDKTVRMVLDGGLSELS